MCVSRHADAQGARQGEEAQRWRQHERLAVETDRNRCHCAYLELETRPLEHPTQSPVLTPGTKRPTDGPEGYEPGDSARTAEACREDAQLAGVETRSGTGTS